MKLTQKDYDGWSSAGNFNTGAGNSSNRIKKVNLTQGKQALVDNEDYSILLTYKWKAVLNKGGKYRAYTCIDGHMVNMSRLLIKCSVGMEVDHINGNSLDNRKSNLRVCSHGQNMWNIGFNRNNTSGYSNISWHKITGKWRVTIRKNNKSYHFGEYKDIKSALKIRDLNKKKLFGEYTRTNI